MATIDHSSAESLAGGSTPIIEAAACGAGDANACGDRDGKGRLAMNILLFDERGPSSARHAARLVIEAPGATNSPP
jgi:hypothetical protein